MWGVRVRRGACFVSERCMIILYAYFVEQLVNIDIFDDGVVSSSSL